MSPTTKATKPGSTRRIEPGDLLTSDQQSTARLHFRPDIEGLRAVAILLVVLYHAGWDRAASGFYGVDVFFVLSGFLISGILLDEVADTDTVSLVNFWARRARRLLPAAAFVTVAVLIALAVLSTPFDQISFGGTARSFAVYGSNILFAVRSADYFARAAATDPLLHTWSLAVEEQFYLFFAPLMLGLAVWTARRGHMAFRRRFGIITIVLSLVSLAGCLIVVRQYPVITFYSLPSRAWEFGLGAMAMLGVGAVSRIPRPWLEAISVAALIALCGSAAIGHSDARPPLGALTLLPTLSAVALILTGAAAQPTLVARLLSTAPLRLLGRLSYSWYLWHWPVLVLFKEAVPGASEYLVLVVAFLSLIPAAATYLWVESPIRFSKRLRAYPRQVVLAALLLSAGTFGCATLAIRWANHTLATPRARAILAARATPSTYANGCQVPLLATESPPCTYGPARNDTTIVLFGDSHAAQWFPALDSVVTLRGWRLVNLTKRGCPSVTVSVPNLGRQYFECDTWRRNTIARIERLRPTIVVVSNDRSYDVFVGKGTLHTDSSAVPRRVWQDGLVQTLTALKPLTAALVVLEDTPQPGFNVPMCLVKYLKNPSRCGTPAVTAALDPVLMETERAAVRAVPGTTMISMNQFICNATACPVTDGGLIRFSDSNHLSVRFSASLAPRLSEALSDALALAGQRGPR